MIISLDGPAGSGKSTVCKRISKILKISHLNSGNFYRAISYIVIKRKLLSNKDKIIECIDNIDLIVDDDLIFIDDIEVNPFLREKEVEENVSYVSSVKEVRDFVNTILKDIAQEKKIIIAEGRDMSSIVFPYADLKFFLTANIETRAKRKYKQKNLDKFDKDIFEEIKRNIEKRDKMDEDKEYGNLHKGENSNFINTSNLTIKEVCNIIVKEYRKKKV